MASKDEGGQAGEELIRQDLITREDLDSAKRREKETGTPWYKQLIQRRKITFGALEDVLRYEFHPKEERTVHQNIGDFLVNEGELKEEELKEALQLQKRNGRLLGKILLEHGFVRHEAIARALSKQYDIEYSLLEDMPSDPTALYNMPESVALKNEIVPVHLEGDRLTVLITSPQTLSRFRDLGVMLGKRLHPVMTASTDIKAEIKARYLSSADDSPSKGKTKKKAVRKSKKEVVDTVTEEIETDNDMKEADTVVDYEEYEKQIDSARFDEIAQQAEGTSVINMVSTIIEGAINSGATDVHLDPQEPEMRVRYRIDGVLHDIMSINDEIETAVVSRIKIIADLDITETRHPQDGHINMEFDEAEFDIRVATLPTYLGERVVLRILDQSSILSGIRDLGIESEDEEKLSGLINQPYGMILVTGPTGSGKTTTLYAALNQKNVMTDSIVTLEDPVEYQLSGINQVQIDTDIDVTFASTLRASLRQDIDVLLVGEIRDAETARIAIRASMTGHLVFSTLHTNDAPEAISTLRNMGIPSYLIASALTGVVGQRLVRRICSECRVDYKPSTGLLKSILLPTTTKKLYKGAGCDACYGTGNHGRTGIFEVLEITTAVRRLITEEATDMDITKACKLKTMAMRCREKVKDGTVTAEEFLRVIRT